MPTPVEIAAAKINANFDSIRTGIKNLDDQITAFNNSPGVLSASDQAALDDIEKNSGLLADAANAVPVSNPNPNPNPNT